MENRTEQLSIEEMNMSSANTENEDYIKRIEKALDNEIHDSDYRKWITVSNTKSYIAIKAKSYIAAKVFVRRAFLKIEVDKKYASLFDGVEVEYNDKNEARIKVKSIEDVISFSYQLGVISMETLAEFGGESFGCCGRYVECSDAKQCIHPDKLFARACAYRRNLEKGKIFYGKNKNI